MSVFIAMAGGGSGYSGGSSYGGGGSSFGWWL